MTIQELADRAEVTTRTIRYYVEQGILPPPERGRPAEYTEEHVARLALIKRLKEQYLPLEEIRDTMKRLSLVEVEDLVAQHSPEEAQTQRLDSAADYISTVLGRGMAREQMKQASPTARMQSPVTPAPHKKVATTERELTGPAVHETMQPYSAPNPPSPPPPAAAVPTPAQAQPSGLAVMPSAPALAPTAAQASGTRTSLASRLLSSVVGRRSSDHDTALAREESANLSVATSWQRVQLGEGIELNFVASDDARFNEKVTRLIESAHHILDEGPGNGE